jgi:hypothetical protein
LDVFCADHGRSLIPAQFLSAFNANRAFTRMVLQEIWFLKPLTEMDPISIAGCTPTAAASIN